MRRLDFTAAAAFAIDGMTVVAAAYNAAWLALLADGPRPRRASAMILALLNVGIAVEALFAQSLYTAHRFELLQDCHVTDIQVLPGIHADCDKGPDAPLLFRADALAALDRAARH